MNNLINDQFYWAITITNILSVLAPIVLLIGAFFLLRRFLSTNEKTEISKKHDLNIDFDRNLMRALQIERHEEKSFRVPISKEFIQVPTLDFVMPEPIYVKIYHNRFVQHPPVKFK